jgi:hypothetical protein
MNRNTPRSTAPRSSSSFAAGGAKKAQKSTAATAVRLSGASLSQSATSTYRADGRPDLSVDGWQTSTPVKGRSAAAPAPMAPKKAAARFPASRFSAFETDSDEEVETVVTALPAAAAETPAEFFARLGREDPILAAVSNGLSWFEAENGEDDHIVKASKARIEAERPAREARAAARLVAEEEAEAARIALLPPPPTAAEQEEQYLSVCHRSEEEFWAQSFTQNLDERIPDYFDTTGLTDDEFHAMLTWVYANGWKVDVCGRDSVKLVSDDGPSRRYIPDNFWTHKPEHGMCCSHKHDKKAKTSTIPRFCRAAVCEEADCRYVHGDTIPKTNRACGFGEGCGASDPTGVKRSQCLFMHPGETWTTESCIHKPEVKAE